MIVIYTFACGNSTPRQIIVPPLHFGEQRHCRTFIDRRLKAYADLDPEVVRKLDDDEFPRPPLYEVKR